jgi:signal transduction histidine kinase
VTGPLSSHLFEMIAQEAIFGIAVFNTEGHSIYTNNVLRQSMSVAEDFKIERLLPKEERPPLKSFSTELLKHDGLYQDILVAKLDGGLMIANIGVKHIEYDGTSAHLIMIQDVTLQKKLQREIIAKQSEIKAAFEELLKQNRQLKDLDVAKDRFIALTTHELRTPLSAMVASAEILNLGLHDDEEQLKEFIGMIYTQGLHLQSLVNDILDFAKIQAGKMDFYIQQHDCAQFTQDLFQQFQNMAEASQITMHFEGSPTPLYCYFDTLRLNQVLSNIINNAIKYNRQGGSVRLHFEDKSDVIKIMVTDTGNGIPADQFEKVFNEFETLGQVSKHHKGTGLGMPISRKLCEGMGGKLNLESELGVGTTFWVELPKEKVLAEVIYRDRPEQGGDLAA